MTGSKYVMVLTAKGLITLTTYQYVVKPRAVKNNPKKRLIRILDIIQFHESNVNLISIKAATINCEKATFKPPNLDEYLSPMVMIKAKLTALISP